MTTLRRSLLAVTLTALAAANLAYEFLALFALEGRGAT